MIANEKSEILDEIKKFRSAWQKAQDHAPSGRAQNVLVLPGYQNSDKNTQKLRDILESKNFKAHASGLKDLNSITVKTKSHRLRKNCMNFMHKQVSAYISLGIAAVVSLEENLRSFILTKSLTL